METDTAEKREQREQQRAEGARAVVLTPYEQAIKHLAESGWRGIAGWNRDAEKLTKKQKSESLIDLFAKNGKTLLLMANAGGGFEVFFPSSKMRIDETLLEIDAHAAGQLIVKLASEQ